MSSDTNMVQNRYANREVIDQVAEVNIRDNKIQINNPLTQKQGRHKCILVY